MKSPNRPPLRPRNNRDMLLHDPSYAVKKEKDRRRQIRIQQAREKANEAAKVVRQRTEREKLRLVSFIELSVPLLFAYLLCSLRKLAMKSFRNLDNRKCKSLLN